MKQIFISVALGVIISLASCTNSQDKTEAQKEKTEVNTLKPPVLLPDTIKVTATAKGKRSQLILLQQKAMLRAKKKLADSIIVLRNLYVDTMIIDASNYEVVINDIHVLTQGVRCFSKNDPATIETYITIGMKYDKPVLKKKIVVEK